MGRYEAYWEDLRSQGRSIGRIPAKFRSTGPKLSEATEQATASNPGFEFAAALAEFAGEYDAVAQALARALEDHGGGLVNCGSNYKNTDYVAEWSFKRVRERAWGA